MTAPTDDILKLESVAVVYNNVISALHDVSLTVPRGKIVPVCSIPSV